jgi:hypothetical protein
MGELTAIDVLIHPDDSMLGRAASVNQRMLQSVPPPQGFALDEHHQPHITVLQRYVNSADLDAVYDAINAVLGAVDLATLAFTAVAIRHMEVGGHPGVGLSGIVVKPGPEVLDFQSRLIDALAPFTGSGGTADAYVRTDAEPEINTATIDYIEHYVPAHSGQNYIAHVTVGLATLDDLGTIEAQPFEPLTFLPAGVSVYQLGNNGTAAKPLKNWAV